MGKLVLMHSWWEDKMVLIVLKCLGIPQMPKIDLQGSVIPLPQIYPQKISFCSHKLLYINVHRSTSHKKFEKWE